MCVETVWPGVDLVVMYNLILYVECKVHIIIMFIQNLMEAYRRTGFTIASVS